MPLNYYYQITESHSLSIFFGAFFGAFFASVFSLAAYIITKRRERFVIHKNALTKLERIFNKHLDSLSLLRIIGISSIDALDKRKVTSNRLLKLHLQEDIYTDIGSTDLLNKLFIYNASIERLNLNVTTINHSLTNLEDLFINGRSVHDKNYIFIIGTIDTLIKDMPSFTERIIKYLALTRIHIARLKSHNTFIYGLRYTQWEQKISKEEIKQEVAKLRKEIEPDKEKG